VADVRRIFRIREDKTALASLLQKGSIDEELWANFQQAEKELEAEIVEVVTEANTFVEGWGQIIFQSAGEIVQNEKHRDIFTKIVENKKDLDLKLARFAPAPDADSETTSATPSPSITMTPAKTQPLNDENLAPVNGKSLPVQDTNHLATPQQQGTNASIGKSGGKKKNKKR